MNTYTRSHWQLFIATCVVAAVCLAFVPTLAHASGTNTDNDSCRPAVTKVFSNKNIQNQLEAVYEYTRRMSGRSSRG